MIRIILALAAFTVPSTAIAQATPATPIARAQFLAEMDGQFRLMDGDKNGQLSRAEIEQYQKQATAAERKAGNQALFALLDLNGNGQLSPAEFAELPTATPPVNAGPMLSREDINRDSQISLVEHRSATLANFDRLDLDRNGLVTPDEMKAGGIR